jgi:hypothetical protein
VSRWPLVLGACGAILVAALVIHAVGAGDGRRSTKTHRTSGIQGVVKNGGCSSADASSCVFAPVAANQRVLRESDERLVKEFRSGSDGSFRVELRPGRYIIEPGPDPERKLGFGTPVTVAVPKSRFVKVIIAYENGQA